MGTHIAPGLEAVAEIIVNLGEPRVFGDTRDGHRRMTPVLGGTLRGLAQAGAGAALEAEILAGGGDHQIVRADGTVEIDARYEARTSAGAYIGIRASGIRRTVESAVYFRVALRFEAAAPELDWLQGALFVADGVREAESVRHTVYRVN